MYSEKLSPPIDITGLTKHSDIENKLYRVFRENIMDKEIRSEFKGKFIFVNLKNCIERKSETFWHLISLNSKEKFNILPCNNCLSITKCYSNCIENERRILMNNSDVRNICYYRGIRIHWINEIINLANKGDPDIKIWRVNKRKGGNRHILDL